MTHGHLALSVEPLTFTFFDDLVIAVARDLALAWIVGVYVPSLHFCYQPIMDDLAPPTAAPLYTSMTVVWPVAIGQCG